MPNLPEEESQIPIKNSLGMKLSDLIRQLKEGKLTGGGEGFRIMSINSKPNLGGFMSLGPEGYPEYGFGQKFEEGFKGWERGDKIRTSYKVRRRTNEGGTKRLELL